MELGKIIEYAAMYGLGNVLSIVILFYVLRENTKREARLATIIEKHLLALHDLLNAHDQRSNLAIKSIEEANRYQREEHIRMIDILNKIDQKMEIFGRLNNHV